jgi:hypothetical protein
MKEMLFKLREIKSQKKRKEKKRKGSGSAIQRYSRIRRLSHLAGLRVLDAHGFDVLQDAHGLQDELDTL